jgi:hypothetical protein
MHLYSIMLATRTKSIGKSESMLEQGMPSIALKPTPLPQFLERARVKGSGRTPRGDASWANVTAPAPGSSSNSEAVSQSFNEHGAHVCASYGQLLWSAWTLQVSELNSDSADREMGCYIALVIAIKEGRLTCNLITLGEAVTNKQHNKWSTTVISSCLILCKTCADSGTNIVHWYG